jgi:glycine/D-amino acid oxidase-like deaminating enzyme
MIALPVNPVSERWHGIYPLHPEQPVFSTTIDGAVRVITGIGGKGMTTGPALARESIDTLTAR